MNSDGSELETCSNNRVYLTTSAMRLPAATTNSPAIYQSSNCTAVETNFTNCADLKLNEFNNMPMTMMAANCDTPADIAAARTSPYSNAFQGKNSERPPERYVWEMRSRSPNVTPASTVLNSPDLNIDMQCSLQLNRQHHHQIRVGRSPGSQFEQHNVLPQGLSSPGSPTDVGKGDIQCLRDGEIVVFDDIDTSWMNKSANNMQQIESEVRQKPSTTAAQQRQHLNYLRQQQRQQHTNNEDVLKVTKMIGQLPIAEYEGSPRRIGNNQANHAVKQSTANIFPKRPPGFPQRVSPMSSAAANNTTASIQKQVCHTKQRISDSLTQTQQRQSLKSQQQQQQPEQLHNQYYNTSSFPRNFSAEFTEDNKKQLIGNLIDIGDDNDGNNGGNANANGAAMTTKTPTFDYLYEFSETRKVLEEFFKANPDDEKRFTDFTESGDDITSGDFERVPQCAEETQLDQAYVGQRLARIPKDELYLVHRSPKKQQTVPCDNAFNEPNDIELYIDSNSRSSCDLADTELEANMRRHSRNFTLSPETTDYDSNCGDLDSLSNDINCQTDYGKLYTSMPVLEDGLSSGHASDTENNATNAVEEDTREKQNFENDINEKGADLSASIILEQHDFHKASISPPHSIHHHHQHHHNHHLHESSYRGGHTNCADVGSSPIIEERLITDLIDVSKTPAPSCNEHDLNNDSSNYDAVYAAPATLLNLKQTPSPMSHSQMFSQLEQTAYEHHDQQQQQQLEKFNSSTDIQEAMKEIRSALQRAKTQPEKLKFCDEVLPPGPESPIWVLRKTLQTNSNNNNNGKMPANLNAEDEEADTDLETDRLLGQQRLEDQGYFDDKTIWPKTSRISGDSNDQSPSTSDVTLLTSNSLSLKPQPFSSATIRQGIGTSLTPETPEHCQIVGGADVTLTSPDKLRYTKSPTGSIKSLKDSANSDKKAKTRNKEGLLEPAVLIEGVLFRARYLGSTQLVCEGQPTKSTRMMQAEEAVSRIKAPEGESQPSTEVDLFISTEKIMVLNTDLKEIMMDHALRTISYIADIGDLVVLMARRRFVPTDSTGAELGNAATDATTQMTDAATSPTSELNNGNGSSNNKENKDNSSNGSGGSNKHTNRTPKMICHVFESDEAQFIAQSIGQAFQVAYMEFLKANGIEDHSFVKEMDYQEVLNSQEIFGDELEIFAKKELQKEVVVPKAKGEILGVVIVESGWGSMLPTVVIANLMSTGAAARCGQLNIGDQLIAINGMSLVGLPLSTCQSYIRNAKNQTAVKFTVVPCPPVVEVKIKRPNTKYQLGFSVQNGVICSLLRGGIAERGGVRVGHRIIEINNQSVVAVPHEKIVNLLATSVGEILMKTMPTSMFRLLTGQENPIYI